MKLKSSKLVPARIAAAVVSFACLLHIFSPFEWIRRVEWITYDWRMRHAAEFTGQVSTNFGFVFISDDSIGAVSDGSLGYRFGLYWPRQVYGRLIEELAAQKAKAICFDVLFGELRADHPPVSLSDDQLVESDDFFAQKSQNSGCVILASTPSLVPPELFRTNCFTLGDISTEKDSDGVLRRAKAFYDYRIWHPLIARIAREAGLDLSKAKVSTGRIQFPMNGGQRAAASLDENGLLDLNELVQSITGEKSDAGLPNVTPFTTRRVWQMGIALAARELGCALSQITVEENRIILRGTSGQRELPIQSDGTFLIDWSLKPTDPRLTIEPIESLLTKHNERSLGDSPESRFAGKLVIVGSTATGNDLTDRGATPLEGDTFLASKHWNIANSILTGRLVRQSSIAVDLLLIAAMGAISVVLSVKLRSFSGAMWLVGVILAYLAASLLLAQKLGIWIPVILPVVSALLVSYALIVSWRALHEQQEKRKIKSLFARMMAPEVVNELLKVENLTKELSARRHMTIYFADVRGFTEMTDTMQAQAEEHVRANKLSGKEAEAHYAEVARETLDTVNIYLATVADIILKHKGTLDKYIGDCVMAFWGAPLDNDQHALCTVRAAVDAQRAIYRLNEQRTAENKRREQENISRIADGKPKLLMLPALSLGSGINSGFANAGLMGSDAQFSYTVFGREVNVASRLEGVSGRGRIIIGEGTYRDIFRDDPKFAATFVQLEAVTVNGIRNAVQIYEVPWKPTSPESLASGLNTQSEVAKT